MDISSRLALGVGRTAARVSRLWDQRGLGTAFKYLHRLPLVGRATCTLEIPHGGLFASDVFEPYWGPVVVGGRTYEPEVMHVVERLAGLGPAFIDGGANYGYWSIIATSLGYAHVVAIEANPATYEKLSANAVLNHNRFVHVNKALGQRSGDRVELGAADEHVVAHVRREATGHGVLVETASIDDIVESLGWQDDRYVIKLDVEDAELAAIAGATRLCARADHAFVFEDWESNGFPTIAHLLGSGYEVFFVTQRGRCIQLRSPSEAANAIKQNPAVGHGKNFVAVRDNGALREAFSSWAAFQSC